MYLRERRKKIAMVLLLKPGNILECGGCRRSDTLEKLPDNTLNCRNPDCIYFAMGLKGVLAGTTARYLIAVRLKSGDAFTISTNPNFGKKSEIIYDLVDKLKKVEKTICPECREESMKAIGDKMFCENCGYGTLEIVKGKS